MAQRSAVPDPKALARRYAAGDTTLKQLGSEFGLTHQRVHQILVDVDPGLPERVRRKRRRASERRQAIERKEREKAIRSTPCAVCLGSIPTHGRSKRSRTCSTECAELWGITVFHLSPERRRAQQLQAARWTVENAEGNPPEKVSHAQRLLAGEETEVRGRWVLSERMRAALLRVYELRQDRTDPRWPIDVPLEDLADGS